MRKRHLCVRHKGRFVRTTDSNHGNSVFSNLYRNRIPANLDEVWVADITCIGLASGFAYHAAIIDACSRRIVDYAVSRHIDTELALAALNAAVESRRPEPGHASIIATGVANTRVRPTGKRRSDYGLIGSMSAVGNPYDNAQAESFMKTLKVEENYLAGYETFADVESSLPVFLEDVYNARRMHTSRLSVAQTIRGSTRPASGLDSGRTLVQSQGLTPITPLSGSILREDQHADHRATLVLHRNLTLSRLLVINA